MYHYFVWVRSNRYHGKDPLTYSSVDKLAIGSIVEVALQNLKVLGFISASTSKPKFKTKSIERVLDIQPMPSHLIRTASWLKDFYPSSIGSVAQLLLPIQLTERRIISVLNHAYPLPTTKTLPSLSAGQVQALSEINVSDSNIVHGVTGSGKTRIYIELALNSIAANKSVIILTPEISLLTQLSGAFKQVFGDRVILQHSHMTPQERQKVWLQCLQSREPIIVLGPRSALFSPVQKLGLIVLDESHENSYKHEQAPYYQAARVASYMSSITRSCLVLGSATPSITDYFMAEQKNKTIIHLDKLVKTDSIDDHSKNEITIVDKKDFSLFDRSSILSSILIKKIQQALSKNEQSLIYLNRRGTARLILCENCGWQAVCPHCDVPLTYHGDFHQLRCHSCNYHEQVPHNCPNCGHNNVIFKTAGTKAVTDELQSLFPHARIARFDTDNATADRFEKHFNAIKAGEIDILVGTQLLAKGLDLPKLSTLGIVLADTSLYLPDFSAQERTFQLITQVLGRVGRGHIGGSTVIQTYHPDHPIIKDAISGSYQSFYERELLERKEFLFPPFCFLLKITVRRAQAKTAEQAAQTIKDDIQNNQIPVRIEGPAPSFYERIQNKYQWQLVVKSKQRSDLVKIISILPSNCTYDIDPQDLL